MEIIRRAPALHQRWVRLGEDHFDREHGRPGELNGVEVSMQFSESNGTVVQPKGMHQFTVVDLVVTDVLAVTPSSIPLPAPPEDEQLRISDRLLRDQWS